MSQSLQVETFQAFGASDSEIVELCRYDEKIYDPDACIDVVLPLDDELFVATWREWTEEAKSASDSSEVLTVLANYLPQLRFPIEEGISKTEPYRQATLSGVDPEFIPEAIGLPFERPETVRLDIYPSFAGGIPILTARHRDAFVTLVQALSKRNEPTAVTPSQGASMVSGLANWKRIRAHQRTWEATPEKKRQHATWQEAFADLRQHPESYRDRFILLSDGPYSAVEARDLDLDEKAWRELSLTIRREHECAHYLTRRVFGSMRNHLLDELIADYTGIVAALGHFRADWFLRFLGLEDFPRCRPGGRVEIYRGKPPLSDGAFEVLQAVVKTAAENLETFDRESHWPTPRDVESRGKMILTLALTSLSELASDDWRACVEEALILASGGERVKE